MTTLETVSPLAVVSVHVLAPFLKTRNADAVKAVGTVIGLAGPDVDYLATVAVFRPSNGPMNSGINSPLLSLKASGLFPSPTRGGKEKVRWL